MYEQVETRCGKPVKSDECNYTFKLTDDRRTTITPGYIAIVGRRLGKWIRMRVAISLSYLWK